MLSLHGLESRQRVRDYESEHWLHDAFLADSEKDSDAYLYFKQKFERTRGRGMSYGAMKAIGFSRNPRWNRVSTSLLCGTSAPNGMHARNVGSADFDQDGRQDLVFTHFETWPDARQVLRCLNRIPEKEIGLASSQKRDSLQPGSSDSGKKRGDESVATISSGDSYRTQHPSVIPLWLGKPKGWIKPRFDGQTARKRRLEDWVSTSMCPLVTPELTPPKGRVQCSAVSE